MKNAILYLSLMSFMFYGCDSNDESGDDTKVINPRKPNQDQVYYGDSVYIVSTHIDTVYSTGQWMDIRHAARKHRQDSIQRAKEKK